jgi:hypothetical protein
LKPLYKYSILLLLLNILFSVIIYFLFRTFTGDIAFIEVFVLSSLFSVIVFISLTIFFRGQKKEPDSQTLHSLTSVSLKFLLDMVLALVWFIVAKKTLLPYVLIFFVLYLALSLFSIWVILKTLKNRSLLNQY